MHPFYLAHKFLGVSEDKREGHHNPQIVAWLDYAGCDWADDDETPWCSAFMYCMCDWTDRPVPVNNILVARSWINLPGFVGIERKTPKGKKNSKLYDLEPTAYYVIKPGDILIFARRNSVVAPVIVQGGKFLPGHVGFSTEEIIMTSVHTDKDKTTVRVLGGNQGDRVSVRPYAVDHLIGYIPMFPKKPETGDLRQ